MVSSHLEEVVLCKQQFPTVVVALCQILVHIVPQALLDLFATLTPAVEDIGRKKPFFKYLKFVIGMNLKSGDFVISKSCPVAFLPFPLTTACKIVNPQICIGKTHNWYTQKGHF